MNILIVKPSSLGDVVHTFPAVRLIRQTAPEATITWLVNDAYAEMVNLCPDVDDVLLFRRQRWGKLGRWHEFFAFTRELKRRKFDLAIDFQGLFRSGVITYLAGVPRRVGFAHAREKASTFYTEKVLLPANLKHAVEKNLFLAASAMKTEMPDDGPCSTELQASHDGGKQAEILFRIHRIDSQKPIVAVAPAARWPSKMFPPDFFAKVLDRVAEARPDVAFWLLGSEDERETGRAVVDECHLCLPATIMGEANLVTLIELLRKSDILLTNDTGPMHVMAAMGKPTVALFGPTNPELTGPYGQGHVVLTGKCEAGPCLERVCRRKGAQQCAAATVSPRETAQAILAQLERQTL